MSILVVEDNIDNCVLAEKILNNYGYQIVIMPNGQSALDYCKSFIPDLILMDLSLPDIDGWEVTRQLRMQNQYDRVPIIAMTAESTTGIHQKAKNEGFSDFLAKPFLPRDLVNIVRKYLT